MTIKQVGAWKRYRALMRTYRKAYSQYYMVMETRGVVTSADPEWKKFHTAQKKLDVFVMTNLCLTMVAQGTVSTTKQEDGKGERDG